MVDDARTSPGGVTAAWIGVRVLAAVSACAALGCLAVAAVHIAVLPGVMVEAQRAGSAWVIGAALLLAGAHAAISAFGFHVAATGERVRAYATASVAVLLVSLAPLLLRGEAALGYTPFQALAAGAGVVAAASAGLAFAADARGTGRACRSAVPAARGTDSGPSAVPTADAQAVEPLPTGTLDALAFSAGPVMELDTMPDADLTSVMPAVSSPASAAPAADDTSALLAAAASRYGSDALVAVEVDEADGEDVPRPAGKRYAR